jgi:hypothetical protein
MKHITKTDNTHENKKDRIANREKENSINPVPKIPAGNYFTHSERCLP